MKPEIHPNFKTINFTCACGAVYVAGSTMEEDFKTEICSACHPFYTGKQKLMDSSGRVDKFVARMKKAQATAEKKVKKVKAKKGEDTEEEPEVKAEA